MFIFSSVTWLPNYEGGSNPILLIAFFFFLFLAIPSVAGWFIWQKVLRGQFFQRCQEAGLTAEEQGFIVEFMHRFHVKKPLEVLVNRGQFDRFLGRVAHRLEHMNLSEEDILREAQFLQSIRKKFGFSHSFNDPKITSTRSLLLNLPIKITFFDSRTKRSFSFHSKIALLNDFYIGMEPPEVDISKEVFNNKKLPLQISFVRENDATYYFDTTLARIVSFPKPLWYIRHSTSIKRGAKQRTLALPASLMIASDNSDGHDSSIIITTLSRDGCRFHFEGQAPEIQTPTNALLNVNIDGKKMLLRTQITDAITKNDKCFYRTTFSGLDAEQGLDLSRFVRKLDVAANKKEGASP